MHSLITETTLPLAILYMPENGSPVVGLYARSGDNCTVTYVQMLVTISDPVIKIQCLAMYTEQLVVSLLRSLCESGS